jgi:hypothetical protein
MRASSVPAVSKKHPWVAGSIRVEVTSPLLLRAGRYCVNLHCVAGKQVLQRAAIVAAASVAQIAT